MTPTLALLFAAVLPQRPGAEEFRSRLNAALTAHHAPLQLEEWKREPQTTTLIARLSPDLRLYAHEDASQKLTSVLLVMSTGSSVRSVALVVTTLVSSTWAGNPELQDEDRGKLFNELGLYDDEWGARGIDGISVRHGVTYRAIHAPNDPLVLLLISWTQEVPLPPAAL